MSREGSRANPDSVFREVRHVSSYLSSVRSKNLVLGWGLARHTNLLPPAFDNRPACSRHGSASIRRSKMDLQEDGPINRLNRFQLPAWSPRLTPATPWLSLRTGSPAANVGVSKPLADQDLSNEPVRRSLARPHKDDHSGKTATQIEQPLRARHGCGKMLPFGAFIMNNPVVAWSVFGFVVALIIFIVAGPMRTSERRTATPAAQQAGLTPQPTPTPSPQTTTVREASAPPPETFPDARRACTLKAAERLPHIPGLEIKQTRTRVLPIPTNWKQEVPPVRVEVDIFAAGQAGTYAFVCATSQSLTVVQPLAN